MVSPWHALSEEAIPGADGHQIEPISARCPWDVPLELVLPAQSIAGGLPEVRPSEGAPAMAKIRLDQHPRVQDQERWVEGQLAAIQGCRGLAFVAVRQETRA